jgi:TPP-dependent pyruvate/acetoin dehydrogenase alpha subunit
MDLPNISVVDTKLATSRESANRIYAQMLLIRRVEETFLDLFSKGQLNGTVHTCIGQEACAVGVISSLDIDNDVVFSNHRAHGHFLAYSGNVRGLIAEVMGKHSGICGGIGGSQHLHTKNFYTNGIQGGIVPLAVGAAFAEKSKGGNSIAVVFLGDGTMGEGTVYEGLNIASLWSLPLLFVLEDNQYAQTTPKSKAHAGSFCERANAFGFRSAHLKVTDVFDVIKATREAVDYVRNSVRPFFLHLETYRFSPHSKGDDYRSENEIEYYKRQDPLKKLESTLDPQNVKKITIEIESDLTSIVAELIKEDETQLDSLTKLSE